MTKIEVGGAALLLIALIAGTASDVAAPKQQRVMGGYHVLAADFHVHSHPFSWAGLAPWDTVIQARYDGLDVIAMTPHNQVWVAKVGQWFSRAIRGPMVLVGEEITAPSYHLLAVGIEEAISPSLPLAQAIAEVHRQGGVAIAAHPYESYWRAYDAEVLRVIDGTEVVRPESQYDEGLRRQLREFFRQAPLTAIGSSDYHGIWRMGYSRTYVFARSRKESAVLDAIREGRTVVYDREFVYGDPTMIRIASENGGLPATVPELPTPGAAGLLSRILTVVGLAILLLCNSK